MEQKEQVASRPKMTVTVEQYGQTKSYVAEGGIAFLLKDDHVALLSAYACTDIELAALMDGMMTTALKMARENPALCKIARNFQPTIVSTSLFGDVENT